MNIIFALPDYSSGVIEVETPKFILWETYKPRPRVWYTFNNGWKQIQRENREKPCCCCCFSHSAYWLPTRKNYFTRWPIPLVVCWTGKREQKKKSGSIPPPPTPHTARSEKMNKITRRIYRRYAGGRSRVRTRIPSARRLGLWVWLRNSTLPSAIIRFPVSLLLSSPGDV